MARIDVVGTSLLCSLVVQMLPQEECDAVVFFEEKAIGGAWGDATIGSTGVRAARFNNIVFPYYSDREKSLTSLSRLFHQIGTETFQISSGFSTTSPLEPSSVMVGNFAEAIRHALAFPHVEVKKEKVWGIRVQPNSVFINEQPYDLDVLPRNAPIGSLDFNYRANGKRSRSSDHRFGSAIRVSIFACCCLVISIIPDQFTARQAIQFLIAWVLSPGASLFRRARRSKNEGTEPGNLVAASSRHKTSYGVSHGI